MATLLQINSSLSGDNGQSTALANKFAKEWLAGNPDGKIVVRDLAASPVPHLDGERFTAFITPADKRTTAQQEVVAYSDSLIKELREADAIVMGVPMYNFGVPSTLKAYFDHVARSGETFRYTETGPEGLLNDVPVYIVAARGGVYAGTPADSQTGYLNAFLGFIGLKNTHFIYAEGLAMGDDAQQDSIKRATAQINELVAA